MLFKNFSSFEGRSSSLRCRDGIVSRPARKVKLRSVIPTVSSLLVGEIDPAISIHADGHPVNDMEEIPPTIVGRRKFPDEFSSGSPISGKSKRTEDIPIREDEDGIRSHCCPLNPELDGRDWDEDYPNFSVQFDLNYEKLLNSCSVPSEDIPLLIPLKGSSSESDEESDGSVIGYTPLKSEASTSRNSPVSLTAIDYAPLENEPLANENSAVFQKYLMPRFLQWTEKTSPYARLEEETMEAWLDDSSDEFEYYDSYVKLLPNVEHTIENESDMEEFEQDSDSENENANLKSTKNEEKKDDDYIDEGDRSDGSKDFSADFKSSKNNFENQSSTKYPSKQSKNEYSKNKDVCKNEQLSKLSAQVRNQNQKEYPELNKDEGNNDFSTDTKSPENNAKIELSTELSNKMCKAEYLKSANANKNGQARWTDKNLNTQDEIRIEKEHVKTNLDSDSTLIDLHYSDDAEKIDTESNFSTEEENKEKKEGKESENAGKNEQQRNLIARDENKNKNKYPEYNTESYSTAIGIHLFDNIDSNSIESNLKIQNDYKDKKEENMSKNSNENEQPISQNAEDENQNKKKCLGCITEKGSTSIDMHLPDSDDRNFIESNLNTHDDYRNKKEKMESQSTDKIENAINLNAEDDYQNKKKYPENGIENGSTSNDIFILDIAYRNDVESNMNTQDDDKEKKDEKESESTNKNENSNTVDANQNEKKYPENNIESDYFSIDTFLLDNTDRTDIESEMNTQDDDKEKKDEKESESTNKNENSNTVDANQNEKKYPENGIENGSTSNDIFILDIAYRNDVESNMNTQDDDKEKKDEKESESTNKNENSNTVDANQNEKKYPENNIESDYFSIDTFLLDNTDRTDIESKMNTQDDYKDKKDDKESESTNKNENSNTVDANQNEKKYPENNIESDYFSIDTFLLDNTDRTDIESKMNTQDDYKDKKDDKESESTNKNENSNTVDANQNEKKYPENNIESDYFSIDTFVLDNTDKTDIESKMNTQDDFKDKKDVKESESTDNNDQSTNLNSENENQNEKRYSENNIENNSRETDMHYFDIAGRNGIESNLNAQDVNKDKKEESENDSKSYYFSENISLPDFDNINRSISNLSTHMTARLKFHDLLRTLLQEEYKVEKEEPENDTKNDFISQVIPLEDIHNINGSISNLNIQDDNEDKNIQIESDLKDDYIFEIPNFREFVSLDRSVLNLNIQEKINDNKTQAENDLMNDYIFEIMSFPDFVNLNESVSSLNTPDKNEDKKEFESYSKNDFISEGLPSTDSNSINEPVLNLTTGHENKDTKKHPESDVKTDYISEGIHWAHFGSENAPVSNSNIQDENKVKKEHPKSNLETSFTENILHLADNEQKEKKVTEIKGFSNNIDDRRTEFSYDFFPESQTKAAIKPKVKENMDNLIGEPYGKTSPKSIKKDETQSGLKRLQRFMSGIYPTKDKNELHFEPSITTDVENKVPLEEKGIVFDANDPLVLADLPVRDSDGFQPVLTEEQKVPSRQPNKLTKFFQSLKKKFERNKKA